MYISVYYILLYIIYYGYLSEELNFFRDPFIHFIEPLVRIRKKFSNFLSEIIVMNINY